MQTNNLITVEGVTYDKREIMLSMTPIFTEGEKTKYNVSARFIPCTADGKTLDEQQKTLFFSDVENSTDVDILTCVGEIQAAIQKLIIAKNI